MTQAEESILVALRIVRGPVLRFALALALLGLARHALLALSDLVAAYVTTADRREIWSNVRLRLTWRILPSVVLRTAGRLRGPVEWFWLLLLDVLSLIYRAGVLLVPTFMVAHVYLWERSLGVAWPAFGVRTADVLSLLTIGAGAVLLLGRVYSPALRAIEPPAAFFKPLIVLAPLCTGVLAMHPTWCPVDYHAVLLLHVLWASLALALWPFARLLAPVHTQLTSVLPQTRWRSEGSLPAPATLPTGM